MSCIVHDSYETLGTVFSLAKAVSLPEQMSNDQLIMAVVEMLVCKPLNMNLVKTVKTGPAILYAL
jgi:hypothetical protein